MFFKIKNKKLKIALVAPIEEPVPPEKYGGTELVVANIIEPLVAAGHEVHLLASGDSKTSAILHPIIPRAMRKEPHINDQRLRDVHKFIAIGKILKTLEEIKPDIVHNHLGWRLMPFRDSIKAPVVTTLHGPLVNEKDRVMYMNFADAPVVSISNSQRKPCQTLNYVGTVYNGIELSKFDYVENQGNYLAFLGRMSPEKGPKMAIEVARAFGMKLVMAAKVDMVDVEYFEKEIKPFIDGKDVVFLGEVGPEEKNKLLKNAYALLGPINWEEPFGLFMIESMACGTPAVVTNLGSTAEVVLDGKTGFVVENNVEAFVEALKKIPTINRADCRKRVEEMFSREVMAEKYLEVYRALLKK